MTQESELERRAASGDKDSQLALARRLEEEGRNEQAREWYARVKSRPCFRPLLADHLPGMPPPRHYANLDF